MSKLNITRSASLTALFFSCLLFQGFAQNTLGKVNIASPNAASLGKYGDIPVSYHTGVPNISLPIYTVTSGSLKLPISLSYHASGLKVEENDSWVGAGWTLNAGGAITRTVKDKPDEKQTNSLQQTYGHYSDYGLTSYWQYDVTTDLSRSKVDGEPDLFFFNFNGYSGKFWFNDDRTPVIMPEQDFKIECSYTPGLWNNSPGVNGGSGRCLDAFIITTNDGTKYYFGSADPLNPLTGTYCDPIEVSSIFTPQSGTTTSQVITSWFLRKIVSADGNFSINLNYKRDKFAFYTFSNPPSNTFGATDIVYHYNLVKNMVAGVQLSSITSDNAQVDFTPGNVRTDLSRWKTPALDENMTDHINEDSRTLGSIVISDKLAVCNKKFIFSYDYFRDNTSTVISNFSGIISDTSRLKLLSMQEQSCDGTMSVPPYNFTYFTEQVPRKFSFSRDHWGYNNGVTTNTTLYPALSTNNVIFNNSDKANRASAWPAMRAGTLNKITYPTGGYTVFDFEANTFTTNIPVSADQIVGGLRIKTISNYDPVTAQTNVTNYSYQTQGTNLSSGILYGKPTYIQIFRNDILKRTNFLGNAAGNGCWTFNSANTVEGQVYIYSDNPVRPMETTQGSLIGYSEVKVSQTNNGYTIYRFAGTLPWQITRDNLAITNITNPSACDVAIPNYPAEPLPNDFYRGLPTYEGNFNESGTLISEKEYYNFFAENPVTTPGRIVYSWSNSSTNFSTTTMYELKTARKTETDVFERTYQPGGLVIAKQTQTLYESIYHHEPTKIITTDSKGKSVEKRIKYAFDYRVAGFENTPNCLTGAASFISYANSLYSSYSAAYLSCGGYTNTCWGIAESNYWTAVFNGRKSYVDCRKTNYTNITPLNTFQTNHDLAKKNALPELQSLLWMQDIYMNSPIEVSEWKDGKLLSSTYTLYSNNRQDAYGIYPDKTLKIDLSTPSSTFTSSVVAASGTTITKDSRYKDLTVFDFDKGNIINVLNRDGIPMAYEWGYNQNLPVVKILNASNKYKETQVPSSVTNTFSFQIGSSSPNSGSLVHIINQSQTGNIVVSIPPGSLPPNANATATYTLTGQTSGYLCAKAFTGGTSCGSTPSSITYSNVLAGTYTLSASVSTTFPSYVFNYSLSDLYQGYILSSAGLKEFFYEGFESTPNITGTPHTGKGFLSGNYTTAFSLPNGRNYKIQWWSFANNQWVLNEQPFFSNITLTGPVDDIRIFPADAQMTTYTYDPLIGMTSQWDPNNKVVYYEYDALRRLSLIRDQDRNIIKKYCYNYAGQVENCNTPVTVYSSVSKSGSFTRNNCGVGYTGGTVTYTVAAGAYTSTISQADADLQAQNDVTNNGQGYANTNGTCTAVPVNVTMTAQNWMGVSGFTIVYTNTTTLVQTTFTLTSAAGIQTLGTLPPGTYNITFSKSGNNTTYLFSVCSSGAVSGKSATFSNITVSSTACNFLQLDSLF
jgi:hypothetical protein